jgi:hypothetical protein
MSLIQEPAPEQGPSVSREARQGQFRRRLWAICFALLTLEIGSFLLVFPWVDAWTLNHVPSLFPSVFAELQDLWDEPIFKAAVSALGAANLCISFLQVSSLFRKK